MSSSHDSAEGGAVTGQRTLFGEWGDGARARGGGEWERKWEHSRGGRRRTFRDASPRKVEDRDRGGLEQRRDE